MRQVVSGIIAVMLLALYGYAVVLVVRDPITEPSEPIVTILSLVGGLVSALVVAVLAITPPGTSPRNAFGGTTGSSLDKVITIVIVAFVIAWLVCGAALLLVWIGNPDATAVVSAAAKSWLGLAVAAAYAYLGIKKPN